VLHHMRHRRCLIGHTGFVGGNLAAQTGFDETYNSSNFRDMAGREFGLVVCSGVSAVKWQANRDPDGDRARIEALAETLDGVRAERFVLISTVDVYPVPRRVDESSDCRSQPNHAYGENRLRFEERVREMFPQALVLRLPALFGPGLRKNALYDLMHGNMLGAINPASSFQWYELGRLWADINDALRVDLTTVNLAVEPIAMSEIVARLFPGVRIGAEAGPAVAYDVRTLHAEAFGGEGGYVMGRDECLEHMARFVAAEGTPT